MTEDTHPEMAPTEEISLISNELRGQMLMLVGDRINTGIPLIAQAHFQKAMEEGYQVLTGGFPSEEIKKDLGRIIDEVNADNLETFVVPGIENWIIQSVMATVRQRKWNIIEVQEEGQAAVRNFVHQEKVHALLEQFGLAPNQLNIRNCMRSIVNQVAGKEDPKRKRSAARLARVMEALKAQKTQTSGPAALNKLLAGPASLPDEKEAASRKEEQKKLQASIRKEQMNHLMQNLGAYVQQGKLSAEDAGRLRSLNKVGQAVGQGKVSQEQGSKIRNTILTGKARVRLERTLKESVDYVVMYQQVFEALKRIDPIYDDGLRFMIRHKEMVNAESQEKGDWRESTEELIENLGTLHLLIEMMDRQDAEVRMIAARLPPYSHVMRRGQERIERLVIDESFVDDLRQKSGEEIGARLNDFDEKVRAQTAAAMLSLNVLVNRLIRRTPFRKEIRTLKISLIIEEFYHSTEDVEEGRARAQEFLRTRLHSLFPDLSAEETEEIQQRGAEIIEAVEKQVLAERAEAAKARGEEEGAKKDDDSLSKEEVKKGVQIGRVAVRAGVGTRFVRFKIMPDGESSKYVLVRRDPDSGELVPMMRRGVKRYVEKNRNGVWETV